MSSFIKAFKKGKEGRNIGLPTGLHVLDTAINGLQRRVVIGVAAAPKVGKSKLINAHFIIYPYLFAPNADTKWIYFSYEMDRVQVEFSFCVFFLWHDYEITTYKDHNNKTQFITTDYLMGRLKDKITHKPVIVSSEIEEKLKLVYYNRIVPLFGEYNDEGIRIKEGKIDFVERKMTATEMTNYIIAHAARFGKFIRDENGRMKSYIPNNPDSYTIIVTDTIRKVKREPKQSIKETVDAWISDSVQLRNLTEFSFIHIIHLNRSISEVERMKFSGEYLYPNGSDIKDSGNLSEEADYILTLFNPNDEQYNIKKHFGLELFDQQNNLLYPDYRSLHLVESRHTICPQHMQLELSGAIGYYKKLGE